MKNVSKYSKITYHDIIKGEFENSENMKVLRAIAKKEIPCTGRMVWKFYKKKIENSNIARSLNNLKKLKLVKVVPGKHRCEVTERPAQHYVLKIKK